MAVDIATLALELDTSGMARAERATSALADKIAAHYQRIEQRFRQANKVLSEGLKLNGGSGQPKSPFTGLDTELDRISARQRRAADEALKHAQALARLKQAQGDTAGAIRTLNSALSGFTGSTNRSLAAQTQLARLQNSQNWTRYASTVREAGESIQQTGYFLTGLSTALLSVGAAAVKSAFDVDKNVNTLKALLGSADAAEARFQKLRNLSQVTPGLTSSLASQLDVQLRVANASEGAINKVLPAIGKLNAVSTLGDPQRFVQNLVQLVTQNFERIDLKELVGQSPLAGQLIKQIFNVDNAIDGAAIRDKAQKLGITTVDAFFTAFADAASKNTALSGVTESLETRFAKIVDRVTLALRPLGEAIIGTLGPIVEKGASLIEGLGNAFNSLPRGAQSAIVVIGALATVIGPAVVGIGAFIQAAGALGNLASVAKSLQAVTVALNATAVASEAAGVAAAGAGAATTVAFAPVLPIALGLAAVLGVAAIAWANYESAADKAAKITTDQIQSTIAQRDQFASLSGELEKSKTSHAGLASVIEKMPAGSQAFAGALKDEGEKLAFVTGELERQKSVRGSTLGTQSTTLAAGLAEQQKELDLLRQKRDALEKEADLVFKAGQAGQQQIIQETTQGRRIESTIQAQQRVEATLQKVIQAEQDATKARDESAQKLGLTEKGLNRTTQGLAEYLRKAGLSAEETNRLTRGLDEYESNQRKAAGATSDTASAMNDLGAAARQAGQDVANAFLQFDLQGIQKGLQGKTQELAQRIVKEGITAKQALKEAQGQVIGTLDAGDNFPSVLTFGEASKREQALKKANEDLNKLLNPSAKSKGSGRRAESDARQLRAAEEELAKATAKARLDIEENTLKKIIDLDKDSFDKRLVSADAYYERLIQNELKLQDVERQRVHAELSASQARLAGAKAGSPEALREKAQQIELEARLSILETERAGTVRKLNDELLKLKTTEKERNDELLKSGAIVGFDANKKFLDKFFGQQDARRDRPESQLRIKETEIQALGNAGLLREQQVTDALILTRRSYREELVKSAEARREEARAAAESEGKFFDSSRFEEEIAGLKAIGSELTRAEALQKRFAEQGVLDYSRLNEGVEDLLASQKGLTEIFSDFRANLVKDQFDLIDSGVDKLTKNLGVLGSAFGTLLKDLARLAASAILKKLLGIDGGQSSLLGFGNASARSASPVSGLGNLITGGGGASGGGGSFLTGGFAGGNPAQAALGGGNGGGIAQKLLSKIPGIGRFFGSSPTAAGSAGASQGIGSSAASLGKAATGIGTQAPGLLASLGATGLLAGGGIGGSLLGGNSQIGRLLGGAGGSLLGGFAAASLINPALLPAFFSNPITAVIGGALIGGALLFRFFGDREFRKFRKEAEKQYQIKVDGKQSGRELYKAEKELGEQMFGKGKFGSKIVETIRSKKGQQLLADYANANGQENNPLARKFRDKTELTDISDPRNRFTRRAMGGSVTAGMPYIVGDGGRPEVFSSRISGEVFPSIKQFEKQLLIALQSSQALGGIFGGAKQQLINQLATRTESQSGSGAPAEFHAAMKMVMGVNVRLAEALNRFESMPAEQVVTTGARKAPTAIAEAVHTSMKQSSAPGLAIKQEVFKGR